MIKGIIFDFFGVLVGDGFEATYSAFGGNPRQDKQFIQDLLDKTNRGSMAHEEFRQQLCQRLGISLEEYQNSIEGIETVNFELLEYIDSLHKNYKTAILSNASKGGLERRIGSDVLNKYFDEIIVSAEVGHIKPEPDIYHLAASRLELELAECVFIDDRQKYVDGAQQVGMRAILYKDFAGFKSDLQAILATGSNN